MTGMIQNALRLTRFGKIATAGLCMASASFHANGGDVVGKVVVGYQGWLSAKGDGSIYDNWSHTNLECWPDMREYTTTFTGCPFNQAGVKQPAFYGNLGNGQPATMFSTWSDQTVNKHVEWMQQYGIDCIALQRFGSELGTSSKKAWKDGIANKIRSAAETYERKYYIMYDISGWGTLTPFNPRFQTEIKTDWTGTMKVHTNSSAYAKENGKPVVCIWGIGGFSDRPGDVTSWTEVVNWFKGQGCYVIGGVTGTFYSSVSNYPAFAACDMVMPWHVGKKSGFGEAYTDGLNWCAANGVAYQTDIYPGTAFSNTDTNRLPNSTPRYHGDFMWTQFAEARNRGVQSIYISMFDELQEATQIFKTAEDASMIPAGKYFLTLNADGVACSSDFYLRLTQDGMKMIKGQIGYVTNHPTDHIGVLGATNVAYFMSQNVPETLFPGETATASVTMKNMGQESWTAAAGHRLGSQSPTNNTFWGISRVDLPQTVAINQECTFTFNITAPTNSGTYNFQWKMVDESGANTGWFGAQTPNIPIAVGWTISNLVKNASFEDTAFWSIPATYSRSFEEASEGVFSLKGTGSGSLGNMSQTISLQTNTVYNINVKLNVLSVGAGSVVFDTWDKFDGSGQGQYVVTGPTAGWQQFSGSFNSGTNTSVRLRVFTATNFAGTFYVDDVQVYDPTVSLANHPPRFSSTPGAFAEVATLYTYTAQASDFDLDALVFSAPIKPAWLAFNATTHVLSGMPSTNELGSHSVVLRTTDGQSSAYQRFTVLVSRSGNDLPEITTLPETGVLENQDYSYTISAIDYDGDTLTYSAPVKPGWLSFNTETQVLSGSPASTNVGMHLVALTVHDGTVTVTQQFNIAVFATPTASNLALNGSFESVSPVPWNLGGSAERTTVLAQDGFASLRIASSGANAPTTQTIAIEPGTTYNVSVRIYAASMATGPVVFDTSDKYDSTCQFVLTSANGGWTEYSGSFLATNTSLTVRMFTEPGFSGAVYFDNVVLASASLTNIAPVITSIPETIANDGSFYSYTLLAADVEGNELTFSEVAVPGWLSFNAETGVLSGTPSAGGDFPVTLRVSDAQDAADQSFTITVNALLQPGYDTWAATNGVGGMVEDDDADGRNNFYEYVLGGNPNSLIDTGVEPFLLRGSNTMEYVHLQRMNDSNLTYWVEIRTNLLSGTWTTNGVSVLKTNAVDESYEEVVNSVPTNSSTTYVRLKVTQEQ